MFDRHTVISSSTHGRVSLILHLIVVRVEHPNSHNYDIENCGKMV